jgi:DNA polymerase III delta prime subunit
MKKKYTSYLWTETFRPQKVIDVILPKAYKRTFNKFVKEGQIPNLLLYSAYPGTGKTSLAKALCNDIGANKLYINASAKGGIDTLRDTIAKFATTKSFNGKPKIVIMDEADGTTHSMQSGLRAFTEQYHKVCRFIFTCNYITKIIKPLQDRCQLYDMNFTDKKVKTEMLPKIFKRVVGMLKFQKVEFDDDVLMKVIETSYPSIRRVVQLCQQYSSINGNIDSAIFDYEKIDEEFYTYVLNKDFKNARKYMIDKSYNYDEMFTNLYRAFVPMLPKREQPHTIITIAEYMYRNAFVIDKEINFSACLLEIMGAE